MSSLVSSTFLLAKQEAISMGDSLKKMSLEEFFNHYHGKYYQTIDISFMEYFLKIIEREGEFVISHLKLKEYGVTTVSKLSHIKERMNNLELIEDQDFILKKVKTSRGQTTHRYYLTPDAFKLCLTKAQRYGDNETDPKIYNQYFILLEKIYKLYSIYQSTYSARIIATKDEKIDNLSEKVDKLLGYANALTNQNDEIIGNTKQILITADTTREQLEENLTYTRQTLLMLEEKSLKSTIDPENPNLVTHYCVLVPKNRNATKTRTIIVRGQMARIDKVIEEHSEDFEAHVSYSANSINLIINAQAKYDQMVTDYITTHNEPIIERNNALAEAINEFNRLARIHNRKHPNNQRTLRSIKEEKEPLLCKKDIPIIFGRTYITYEQNRFFKYEQVVNCIETMKLETQRSPAESFDEAEQASLEAIASVKTIIDSASDMIGKLPKRSSSKET